MDSSEPPPRWSEVEGRLPRDFYDQVVALLTDDMDGSMKLESSVTRSENWSIKITGMPSADELVREIRRLRDMALGSPEQAAEAQLTWTREELARTKDALGRFQRYYEEWLDFHSELSSTLALDTTQSVEPPFLAARRTAGRDEVLAEVRRLKALEPPSND